MKACLACGCRYRAVDWTCPSCRAVPGTRGGFLAFGLTLQNDLATAPDAQYLDSEIRRAEDRHFWFRARVRLVQWMLRRYFPQAQSLLDLGCGTGFVLERLRRGMPSLTLAGCDTRSEALAIARQRLGDVPLFAADVLALPYDSEFDVVTALDVLEHLDDDGAALEALWNVIKPGGGLIATVPQHPWLWSEVDEFSCHRRRYMRSEFQSKINTAGFEILRSTSMFAVTLPLLAISRLWRRPAGAFSPADELRVRLTPNRILGALASVERLLIQTGTSVPFGSSRLVVARRPIAP